MQGFPSKASTAQSTIFMVTYIIHRINVSPSTLPYLPIWRMYTLVDLLAKTDNFGLKIRIIWAHCDEFLITLNPFKTSPNLESEYPG